MAKIKWINIVRQQTNGGGMSQYGGGMTHVPRKGNHQTVKPQS